jgi:hypothetical protein
VDPMTTGVVVVAGAAVLAWVLRGFSRGDEEVDRSMLPGGAPESGHGGAPEAALESGDERGPGAEWEPGGDEVAVVASNGWMFLPFDGGVRLWAPSGEAVDPGEAPEGQGAELRPAATLSSGDLIAARVASGPPGEEPWRVEALGRDREFSAWEFETEEAARAACDLLERLVVKVPLGEDGEPEPVGDEEIAEARRIVEDTLRELAAEPGPEPPEEPMG